MIKILIFACCISLVVSYGHYCELVDEAGMNGVKPIDAVDRACQVWRACLPIVIRAEQQCHCAQQYYFTLATLDGTQSMRSKLLTTINDCVNYTYDPNKYYIGNVWSGFTYLPIYGAGNYITIHNRSNVKVFLAKNDYEKWTKALLVDPYIDITLGEFGGGVVNEGEVVIVNSAKMGEMSWIHYDESNQTMLQYPDESNKTVETILIVSFVILALISLIGLNRISKNIIQSRSC